MRDPNRINEILTELEKVWKDNPDFRLGQLITVATRTRTPHPGTFYIEDDKILKGIKNFNQPKEVGDSLAPYWERYPEIIRIKVEELSVELIKEFLIESTNETGRCVITPIKMMQLVGAPVHDEAWMKGHHDRLEKLNSILIELENSGEIEVVELGYGIVNKKVPNNE